MGKAVFSAYFVDDSLSSKKREGGSCKNEALATLGKRGGRLMLWMSSEVICTRFIERSLQNVGCFCATGGHNMPSPMYMRSIGFLLSCKIVMHRRFHRLSMFSQPQTDISKRLRTESNTWYPFQVKTSDIMKAVTKWEMIQISNYICLAHQNLINHSKHLINIYLLLIGI